MNLNDPFNPSKQPTPAKYKDSTGNNGLLMAWPPGPICHIKYPTYTDVCDIPDLDHLFDPFTKKFIGVAM